VLVRTSQKYLMFNRYGDIRDSGAFKKVQPRSGCSRRPQSADRPALRSSLSEQNLKYTPHILIRLNHNKPTRDQLLA